MRVANTLLIAALLRAELLALHGAKTLFPYDDYPGLHKGISPAEMQTDIAMALRWSTVLMATEAIESYLANWFQAAILCAGSTLERVLKAEYRAVHGDLPKRKGGHWTLGEICKTGALDWSQTKIDEGDVAQIASIVRDRNSRAHAVLEAESPGDAYLGGDFDRIQTGDFTGVIFPYKGEAKRMMAVMFSVLDKVYGTS